MSPGADRGWLDEAADERVSRALDASADRTAALKAELAAARAGVRQHNAAIREVLEAADAWEDAYATGIDGPRLEAAAGRLAGAVRTWRGVPHR